jgi:hypothetical protein
MQIDYEILLFTHFGIFDYLGLQRNYVDDYWDRLFS